MSEHRGVAYEINKAETQWVWVIDPKDPASKGRLRAFTYSTRREADAACRKEIDRGSNTNRA